MKTPSADEILSAVQKWVRSVVVDLNLCPFAKRELATDRIRFVLSEATLPEQLLMRLQDELELLERNSDIETTVLVHPQILQKFDDYNQFLELGDGLIKQLGFEGVFQIASFHPNYQFAGTETNDPENYTNRSPYPLLHILREASLSVAIDSYPDVDQIPDRNIALMNEMGQTKMQALLEACTED